MPQPSDLHTSPERTLVLSPTLRSMPPAVRHLLARFQPTMTLDRGEEEGADALAVKYVLQDVANSTPDTIGDLFMTFRHPAEVREDVSSRSGPVASFASTFPEDLAEYLIRQGLPFSQTVLVLSAACGRCLNVIEHACTGGEHGYPYDSESYRRTNTSCGLCTRQAYGFLDLNGQPVLNHDGTERVVVLPSIEEAVSPAEAPNRTEA